MAALEDVQQRLANAVGKLDGATEQINTALTQCEESREALGQALAGATDAEVIGALRSQRTTAEQLDEARGKVKAIRDRITTYLASIGADRSSASESKPLESGRPAPPKQPPNAVGVDGSEYPPEAAWAVPELPPRVRQLGDRTVAKIKIGDTPLPGSFRSGQRDVWSEEAAERISSLGIDVPDYLANHVEVRAAAMMLRAGIRSATVVLNNVPCGYQTRPPGCHQLLEQFLPEGSDVTVQGTDRKGRPYQRTYHGRARR
ncbi:DddA-like double-stranded DNA deaminase toxin [Saccharopolyspora sp. 5N708]|uniref:DddA-like double-stranded DNA deaminase toxin n=1 Tax=Saccharopolyspora sp. 5N708 TaxID=3457424 RepID=UPI003FD274C1